MVCFKFLHIVSRVVGHTTVSTGAYSKEQQFLLRIFRLPNQFAVERGHKSEWWFTSVPRAGKQQLFFLDNQDHIQLDLGYQLDGNLREGHLVLARPGQECHDHDAGFALVVSEQFHSQVECAVNIPGK